MCVAGATLDTAHTLSSGMFRYSSLMCCIKLQADKYLKLSDVDVKKLSEEEGDTMEMLWMILNDVEIL